MASIARICATCALAPPAAGRALINFMAHAAIATRIAAALVDIHVTVASKGRIVEVLDSSRAIHDVALCFVILNRGVITLQHLERT